MSQDRSVPRNIWSVECELGEGPVWADGALWFVDIKKRKIHRCDAAGGDRRSWDAPEQIGFLLPAEGGGFVAGLESGLHHFDPETGSFRLIVEVEPGIPTNRLNDGVVDPSGRLWFGTMDNGESAPTGSFYSYFQGELRHSGISGIPITNGPAVSPDGRILYWIDTVGRTMHAADIAADGSLGPSRPLVTIAEGEGFPDGPTVDAEGAIWISLYWGGAARRYSPAGALLETIAFPVSNITKIAFGGADLRTAFATTARQGIKPEDLGKQPEAGALFAFEVDVPGFPCPRARLYRYPDPIPS
jgi:D-xylonolactonase